MTDNRNPTLNLAFEAKDIPWLFHMLSLQIATCMCYGREASQAKERIKSYIEQVKEFFPTLAWHEIREYVFFDSMVALSKAATWSFYQEKPCYEWESKSWWKPCVLVCDGLIFEITNAQKYDKETVLAMLEFFKTAAPLESQYIEHESMRREIRESFFE